MVPVDCSVMFSRYGVDLAAQGIKEFGFALLRTAAGSIVNLLLEVCVVRNGEIFRIAMGKE